MDFSKALSIVLTLAVAHRVVAPVEVGVSEADLDTAITMVKDRVDALHEAERKTRRPKRR
jgi:hypothetical protein